jgi:hypothetical protein
MPRIRYRKKVSASGLAKIDQAIAKVQQEAWDKLGRLRGVPLMDENRLLTASKHAISQERAHCQTVMNACSEAAPGVALPSWSTRWEDRQHSSFKLALKIYKEYKKRIQVLDEEINRRVRESNVRSRKRREKKEQKKVLAQRKKAQLLEQRKKKPYCIIECYLCEGTGVSMSFDEKGNETGPVNCPNCNKIGYFIQNEPPRIQGLGSAAYQEGEDGVFRLLKEKFSWSTPSVPKEAWKNKRLEDRVSQVPPGAKIKVTRLIDFEHHG